MFNLGVKQCKDHNGKVFDSIKEMCSEYGVSPSLYTKRLSRGYTTEQALLGKNPDRRLDHNGKQFYTVKDMCAFYGVHASTYTARLQAGYTKKQALTPTDTYHCVDLKGNRHIDHLGHKFKTTKEMCTFHGVPLRTYWGRVQRGSTEEALTGKKPNK